MKKMPLFIDMQQKNVLVVGGGQVAWKRTQQFVQYGACVTVVAPHIISEFFPYIKEEKIIWQKNEFDPKYLKDVQWIVSATGQAEVQQRIQQYKEPHQFVSMADDVMQSDVIVGSVIEEGDLQIAVTTNGASPTYTKELTKQIRTLLPNDVAEYIAFLKKARKKIKEYVKDEEEKRYQLRNVLHERYQNRIEQEKLLNMIEEN